MPAILATKLGMTQVFQDDGSVARVTVLQAGPCPVTAVRTSGRDGYDALQLAFGEIRPKGLSKAELGHLAKADAPPLRRLAEFRGETGKDIGESVTVGEFEVVAVDEKENLLLLRGSVPGPRGGLVEVRSDA